MVDTKNSLQTGQVINRLKSFKVASKQSYGFAKTYMAMLSDITKLVRGLNKYRKIGEQKLTFEQAFPKVGKPVSVKAKQALIAYQNKNKKENVLTQVLREMKVTKDDIMNVNERINKRNKLNSINYKKEVQKRRIELHKDILSLEPHVVENITKGLKILRKARRLLSPSVVLFEHIKYKETNNTRKNLLKSIQKQIEAYKFTKENPHLNVNSREYKDLLEWETKLKNEIAKRKLTDKKFKN